jgi:translocation and assembly module TamA
LQIKQTQYYKLILGIFFLLLLLPVRGAINKLEFTVVGVKGAVKKNIKHRLIELYPKNTIYAEDPEQLKLQVGRAMEPYGFFYPQINIQSHKNKVLIQVVPGPVMRITTLHVAITGDGDNNPDITQALQTLPIKQGDIFNNELYEQAKQNLQSAAEHQGYLHNKFTRSEVLIDKVNDTIVVHLDMETGPQYYFGQVQFDPTYISSEVLSRYIPFAYGEPYSTDKVLAFNNNLSASGYFQSVVVKPLTKDVTYVPVKVHFQKTQRISYSLGVGYGTDTGPRGRAGLSVIPVNRWGHKFNAIVQGSLNENAILTQYIVPGKHPLEDNYVFSGNFANLNYPVGYSNSLLFSAAQQHSKNNFQRVLSINALGERFNYFELPKTTKFVLYPKALFTWRQVEDQLFSPSGYNFTITGLGAAKGGLSSINFFQATLDGKVAVALKPVRTRLFFHTIQGVTTIDNIYDLPLSLAPLLGGAENLKAYSYNSIGPGKIINFGSMEIQKETYEKWYFNLFYDTGDVYKPFHKGFKHDIGVSIMWVSPVGPLKIGVAQAIDNSFHRDKDRSPKLVINMGPDL